MVRVLPSFVTGILCNVLIALLVGRIPVVYLIGEWRLVFAFVVGGTERPYSCRHASDSIWEYILRARQQRPVLLVVWFP